MLTRHYYHRPAGCHRRPPIDAYNLGAAVDGQVIEQTRKWVDRIVVGLNLCPFARRVTEAGRVRYAVTDAEGEGDLLAALEAELALLAAADRAAVETAILIHPRALTLFPDYLDFLPEADRLVRRLGLRGVVQIAGFHPAYQFRGTEPDAVENATNRSPYPMLHLLREASVSEVVSDADTAAAISRRNVETLRGLGTAGVQSRLDADR
jgi:hypothetical protein